MAESGAELEEKCSFYEPHMTSLLSEMNQGLIYNSDKIRKTFHAPADINNTARAVNSTMNLQFVVDQLLRHMSINSSHLAFIMEMDHTKPPAN